MNAHRLHRVPARRHHRWWVGPLVATLLAAVSAPSVGAFESRLEGLQDVVAQRAAETGVGELPRSREKRVLATVLRKLERPREGLLKDLQVASKVFRMLDRRFPDDSLIDGAVTDSASVLHDDVMEERAALLAWMGRTGSDSGESRLGMGIAHMDRRLAQADAEPDRARHARLLCQALRKVTKTRKSLRLDAPKSEPPPFEGTAPGFSLMDVNPSSATGGGSVSPGDFEGMITAWFFMRST